MASQEKEENVVKEPRNPIIKKNLIKSSEKFLVFTIEIKYPIKNEPKMLTIDVA